MSRWTGKVAVVTGASSGIGAVIAVDLANIGLKVIGLARRVERVEALKPRLIGKSELYARKCDLTNVEDVKVTFKWITDNFGGVDILINNAGGYTWGDLVDPTKTEQYVLDVHTNVLAPVYCVQEAFHSMEDRDVDGHIININALLGHSVLQYPYSFNIYPPTKFALRAMTEVLRQEFERLHSKVKVSSLSPGLVKTEVTDDLIANTPHLKFLLPEDVSEAVKYILSTPPRVKIHELIMMA